jgi:hypothetical protein
VYDEVWVGDALKVVLESSILGRYYGCVCIEYIVVIPPS